MSAAVASPGTALGVRGLHVARGDRAILQGVDLDVQPVLCIVVDWRTVEHVVPMGSPVESIVRSGAAPPGSPPLYLTLRVLRN